MQRKIERKIWVSTIAIMSIGLMAIYSASSQSTRVSQDIFYDQLFCAALGLILMYFLSRFDYRRFFDFAYILYVINVILLVAVLAIGRHILGAKRWLEIGSINFQPSELMKLVMILVLSRYLSQQRSAHLFRSRDRMQILWSELAVPFLLTVVPMLLVFKQPDLGTAIMIFGIFVAMVFINGLKFVYFFSSLALCLMTTPFLWHLLKPYQKDRLMVFLNPNIDPLGAGYTIIQSKIAIGSGRFFGKGWLSGTQSQLNFLPERHTDFIFGVIGEEWGLFGSLLLIICFFVLVDCGIKIAQQIKDRFGFSVALGIVSIIALQAIINIGMVLGLFPVVGLTLPLVSYGRSSFLSFVTMIGILLNLNKKRVSL